MADPTVEPAQAGPGDAGEDAFGVPHAHQVSDQLHLWILLPGIVLLLLAGKQFPKRCLYINCQQYTCVCVCDITGGIVT